MSKLIRKFARDDAGAALIEYTIILGLVTVTIIGVLGTFSADVQAIWTAMVGAVNAAAPAGG